MNTLNDVATKLNALASQAGGGHLSNGEIEKKLHDISREVFDLAFELRKCADIIIPYLGISEQVYRALLRKENIEHNRMIDAIEKREVIE